jgi:alkylhydroperoxidase family enzyme
MARMNYVDSDNCHWLTKEILARRNNRNIHRMLGHSGPVGDAFVRLAVTLRYESALDPVLREFAILRVGLLSNARYEVEAHKRIALRFGMTEPKIDALERGDAQSAVFSEIERNVILFTDDVVKNVRAGDATFDPLLAQLGERAIVELVVTIGYYMSVCRFLATFDVDIDPSSP